jgi:uncharacterized phiE125 gp8 family phage protein
MNERYALRVITPPAYEAISLAETRRYLNVDADITDRDAEISACIAAARGWIEAYTGLSLIQQTLEMVMDAYPRCGYIELPRSPVISVDSITYVDGDGATQVWAAANYQTDLINVPGRITGAYNGDFPTSLRADLNAWRVRFTAGHPITGSPVDEAAASEHVPELAKLAMKIYVMGAFEGELEKMLPTAELVAHSLRTSIL